MGDLKAQNLVDADGNSLIAWIVTGKDAAISLYQDPDFADKNMLTIGPLRKVQLSTMPRISPDGKTLLSFFTHFVLLNFNYNPLFHLFF